LIFITKDTLWGEKKRKEKKKEKVALDVTFVNCETYLYTWIIDGLDMVVPWPLQHMFVN
jgi:hypothetical protein